MGIHSKPNTKDFDLNYSRIFGKNKIQPGKYVYDERLNQIIKIKKDRHYKRFKDKEEKNRNSYSDTK